jgi:hypothetical protein
MLMRCIVDVETRGKNHMNKKGVCSFCKGRLLLYERFNVADGYPLPRMRC